MDASDSYIATLALFCLTYNHLLVVMDDEEVRLVYVTRSSCCALSNQSFQT